MNGIIQWDQALKSHVNQAVQPNPVYGKATRGNNEPKRKPKRAAK